MQPQRQQDLHLGRNMDGLIRRQKTARRDAFFVILFALALGGWIGYMGLKNPEAQFVTKWLIADSVIVVFLLWFSWVRRRFWAAMLLLVFAAMFAWLVNQSEGEMRYWEGLVSKYVYGQSQHLIEQIQPSTAPAPTAEPVE